MDIKILKPGDKVLVECTVQAVFANSKMVMVTTRDCTEGFDAYVDEIQEPKTGHWIANAPQYDMLNPQYICSECGNAHIRTTPYCEMCGAKMVEPQAEKEQEDGKCK